MFDTVTFPAEICMDCADSGRAAELGYALVALAVGRFTCGVCEVNSNARHFDADETDSAPVEFEPLTNRYSLRVAQLFRFLVG